MATERGSAARAQQCNCVLCTLRHSLGGYKVPKAYLFDLNHGQATALRVCISRM